MKRLLSLLALVMLVLSANCTRIAENNDPIIGIWSKTDNTVANKSSEPSSLQEWIFNDAYLGRYHKYIDKKLEFKTDFKWSRDGDVYIISYPGTDLTDDIVTMENTSDGITVLQETEEILAIRE
ncbi:hypothetical protein K8352_02755 [Flavobacteriaceae bacterium F89]|uniref:Lipocalin-like domain-containing protein n=1 Tax=Cerina litoralis TaxID=2874477 RepID=A0AAE3JMB9_9FLAO|nr:hypothetical protein [Cerina litoralis]MCG2459660.1 hypothetical protein [Cerina litoralis]